MGPHICVKTSRCPCAGDPIEVGAALTVLQGGAVPVALNAAKSRLGHAEPAAGAIGMLQVTRSAVFCARVVNTSSFAIFMLPHKQQMRLTAGTADFPVLCPAFHVGVADLPVSGFELVCPATAVGSAPWSSLFGQTAVRVLSTWK